MEQHGTCKRREITPLPRGYPLTSLHRSSRGMYSSLAGIWKLAKHFNTVSKTRLSRKPPCLAPSGEGTRTFMSKRYGKPELQSPLSDMTTLLPPLRKPTGFPENSTDAT